MDRFDALARNAYWLNVTRFYCGCYSTGELPSLVDGLISMGQTEQYAGTAYVTELSLALLGDYVFSQQPRSVTRLTTFLFDLDMFRIMLAGIYAGKNPNSVILPEGSGRDRLLDKAISVYKGARNFDTAFTSATVIKANSDKESIFEIWNASKDGFGPDQALSFGDRLDIVDTMPLEDLVKLVDQYGPEALLFCVVRGRYELLALRNEFWQQFVELSLDGRASWLAFRDLTRVANDPRGKSVTLVLMVLIAISVCDAEERHPSRTLLDRLRNVTPIFHVSTEDACEADIDDGSNLLFQRDLLAVARVLAAAEMTASPTFESQISRFLDLLVRDFGRRTLIIDAAIGALNWFSKHGAGLGYTGFLATLSEAWTCSDPAEWWKARLAPTAASQDRLLIVKQYFARADEQMLGDTIMLFSNLVESLTLEEFRSLCAPDFEFRFSFQAGDRSELGLELEPALLKMAGARTGALISSSVAPAARDQIFVAVLQNYEGQESDIHAARASGAWHYANRNPEFWPDALTIIADCYSRGASMDSVNSDGTRASLPAREAKRVVQSPWLYPLSIVSVAEGELARRTGAQVIPVGNIAARERWFEEA
jgi:hypothetical protein